MQITFGNDDPIAVRHRAARFQHAQHFVGDFVIGHRIKIEGDRHHVAVERHAAQGGGIARQCKDRNGGVDA